MPPKGLEVVAVSTLNILAFPSRCWEEDALVRGAGIIPEEPQLSKQRGVLLSFFGGRLGRLLMLQTQPLDLLQDLPG